MSKNEKTANDSYLIVKGEEKEMKKSHIVAIL